MTASTIGDVVRWHAERNGKPRTKHERDSRRTLEALAAAIGPKPLDLCNAKDLLQFLPSIAGTQEGRRVRASQVRPVFRQAFEAGLTTCNPFAAAIIKKPATDPGLTDDEFRAWLRSSRPHVRRVLVMLRYADITATLLRSLRWQDIDMHANSFERKNVRDHRRRHVALNRVTAKLLAWLRRHRTRGEHLFRSAHGKPWSADRLPHELHAVRVRAGTPAGKRLHCDWEKIVKLAGEPTTWLIDLLNPPKRMPELLWKPREPRGDAGTGTPASKRLR